MIVILGLIILIAAVVVGVAGVLTNAGGAHGLTHGFGVFGYHVTGSTGPCSCTALWSGRSRCSGSASC